MDKNQASDMRYDMLRAGIFSSDMWEKMRGTHIYAHEKWICVKNGSEEFSRSFFGPAFERPEQ